MRPGGSKAKGSAWERSVGQNLSLWLTSGTRNDLFSRTVLSGGQFTRSQGLRGASGDLMPNHPAAFCFLEKFTVECKHWRDAGLQEFLLKGSKKSLLARAIKQAEVPGKIPLLIVKENFVPAFLISYNASVSYLVSGYGTLHVLVNGQYILMTFEDFLSIPPERIIGEPKPITVPSSQRVRPIT